MATLSRDKVAVARRSCTIKVAVSTADLLSLYWRTRPPPRRDLALVYMNIIVGLSITVQCNRIGLT